MISVSQAIEIVQNSVLPTRDFEQIEVSEAMGYVLCEDVFSEINMPPFRQSAMDGYALCLHEMMEYNIVGEVQAGGDAHPILKKGEAVRIFTGAPVPDTADAVIMQEKVFNNGENIALKTAISKDENIRSLGEQVKKDQIALKKGTVLTPAGIGYLTSLGITQVKIYKKPSIAIVVTGNELANPGEDLKYGQIYESNGVMLTTALTGLGYQKVTNYRVNDDYENTKETLRKVINQHDVVLISGGISVGDYDFVGKALKALEVKELFYKVKQKPGKPLFFGKKEDKIIFALPGNPGAALSCFYVYVHLALERLAGNTYFSVSKIRACVTTSFTKKGDRAQFLKATYNNGEVAIVGGQNSSMLHTFALANALVYLPEEAESITKNNLVEVILLPLN